MIWCQAQNSSKHGLHLGALLLVLAVAGCTHSAARSDSSDKPLNWLEGCWQTEDQSVEETWAQSVQGDQLFGYSVTSKNSQRVFFEQLRIDLEGQHATLNAYPKGLGPTPFKATLAEPYSVEFLNAENDYPQRIKYTLVNGGLEASIAMIDQSKPASWSYRRCK